MDRTKQLETAKCNWEYAGRCCHYDGITRCTLGVESGECHFRGNPAALTPAEKGPLTCPRCNNSLDNGRNSAIWVCDRHGCGYSQSDSAQRPPYPAPREGYHAGEYRKPKAGEAFFCEWTPQFGQIGIADVDWQTKERWIAVKDAPVSEPVVCSTSSFCDGCSNYVSRFCVVSLAFCKGCQGGSKNDKDKPSPVKVPVVDLVTTFVCPRCGDEMMQDAELCGDPWVCFKCDFPFGNTARKPAIEPLDDRDYGRAELKAKINELIARVNALEGEK